MALIVEDGSIVKDAEAYATVAEVAAYLVARGVTTWGAMALPDQESSIRRATDYLVQTYRGRWKGARLRFDQALDWPRQGVTVDDSENIAGSGSMAYLVPYNVVPREVKNACAEMALRAAAGPLLDDLGQGVKTVRVGPIIKEFDTHSSREKKYPAVDRMLEPLVSDLSSAGGSSLKITRC
jgi:hypothetical protein